ncbi:MAG: crossover junction endodeoxyribonuclease RuvC [Candidatus Firestonebacteria bacterium]|nr:crossover junction endodeoxyribonuclease RuvC [Candidatus Firestonebacteria bacterium]
MKVLGIDPGIALTGYGIIESSGNKLAPLAYGCITTLSNDTLTHRLKIIYHDLIEIINKYEPEVLSVEELFFAANTKTAITVGHARGVIILAAANSNISVAEYTPLEIKQALTGYGHAEKHQVQNMVKNLLGLSSIPKPDDIADGLAASICHINSYKLKQFNNTKKLKR